MNLTDELLTQGRDFNWGTDRQRRWQAQFCSVAQLYMTLCDPMNHRMPGSRSITSSWRLPKLMSIESVMSSNHFILCHPLLLLPSNFPSIKFFLMSQFFTSGGQSICTSNEYPGLISFRRDWLDFLSVQGTLKSLPQHHRSKASTLWHSTFFMVQLSHPYLTTGKAMIILVLFYDESYVRRQ